VSGVTARATSGDPPSLPRISYLVFRLERHIRARLDDALARHGVTSTEYMALSELRLRDGLSSTQLARIAFVTPQAMNLVIRDMENRGLIRRTPDLTRGRMLRASLSRKGRSTLDRCDRALDAIEDLMLAETDDKTRKALTEILIECARALRATVTAGSSVPGSPGPRRTRRVVR
jgi:DNA-binding MarR family transcriptional regulator